MESWEESLEEWSSNELDYNLEDAREWCRDKDIEDMEAVNDFITFLLQNGIVTVADVERQDFDELCRRLDQYLEKRTEQEKRHAEQRKREREATDIYEMRKRDREDVKRLRREQERQEARARMIY